MAVRTHVLVPALKLQYDFHFDETRRLLEVARRLPEDRFGGIQHIFAHILGADRFWRSVVTGELRSDHVPFDDASIVGLIALTAAERVSWDKVFVLMDDNRLIERVERTLPFGAFSFTIGQAMQHVILHGHQHHAEIAHLLTEAGHSPGDVDFFDYVAERLTTSSPSAGG
jgi:uncharacterized damage-inducible protein DinB